MKPELLDPPVAPAAAPARAADEPIFGRPNIMWGWVGIVLGPTVGSILMAWCFAGPFPSPMERLADYDGVERRMLRLAHVAMVMIPLINVVFGMHLDRAVLSPVWKRRASTLALIAIPGVPIGLTLGALIWVPLKWLSVPGVYAFIAALAINAVGQWRRYRDPA
jgi:hypothetical protein